jgi:hypothetical protein
VSALTGETVEIDAPAFFANAPNDLRTLLPTHFEHEKFNGTGVCADQACQYMTKKIAGVTKKYRNFSQSIADQWSVSVYKPYVIKINGNGNYKAAELKSAARIIGESFGGLLLAGPFTGAIL